MESYSRILTHLIRLVLARLTENSTEETWQDVQSEVEWICQFCTQESVQKRKNGRKQWSAPERLICGRVLDFAKDEEHCSLRQLISRTFLRDEELYDVGRVLMMMETEGLITTKTKANELVINLTAMGKSIADSGKIY
jgi:hypothetical protein